MLDSLLVAVAELSRTWFVHSFEVDFCTVCEFYFICNYYVWFV